ncbi:MAG TPA: NRDE family protein, partial [Acidimicrobiales bacterium]|nr:NRDE family protein [Acidimicrobiales bacterium]
MCLLIVCSQVIDDFPLVVAANRDERLDRPAVSISRLREANPVILGGLDKLAGGTWLAVNEHGVVAGLTNRPTAEGRDPTRRSRGEIPILLTAARSAKDAADSFVASARPSTYNPAWVLVGDRRSLEYVNVDQDGDFESVSLRAGIHVLENRPLDGPSSKADRARRLLGDPSVLDRHALLERLVAVLSDHETDSPASDRRSATTACCVHDEKYGTRSSMIVLVPR